MADEQARLLEAVKYAIQMEVDGKKYYAMVSGEISNKVGKELYAYLSDQEDYHRRKFEAIYKSITEKQGWPPEVIQPERTFKLATLFADAIKSEGKSSRPDRYSLDATAKAVDMEIKSRDFYREQASKSSGDLERRFFSSIAAEEQGHYLALVDYKEYVQDPIGWFTRTEHPHLDGI